ncbi:MAG: ATP-binding protein [Comamonadaceae bacterium]|nr:ATP-binding protein [Comamonadaceae bacterium]
MERKRLFGLAPEQRSEPADADRLYGRAMGRRTLARLEQLAGVALAAGSATIVDATFLHRSSRDRFRRLARPARPALRHHRLQGRAGTGAPAPRPARAARQ